MILERVHWREEQDRRHWRVDKRSRKLDGWRSTREERGHPESSGQPGHHCGRRFTPVRSARERRALSASLLLFRAGSPPDLNNHFAPWATSSRSRGPLGLGSTHRATQLVAVHNRCVGRIGGVRPRCILQSDGRGGSAGCEAGVVEGGGAGRRECRRGGRDRAELFVAG